MAKHEIHANIYAGWFDGKGIDGDYELGLSFTVLETDDLEEAKRMFDAITTTDTYICGEGMRGKTMGLYLHYKYPDYEGIYLDLFLDSDDYCDCVYEELYIKEDYQ